MNRRKTISYIKLIKKHKNITRLRTVLRKWAMSFIMNKYDGGDYF